MVVEYKDPWSPYEGLKSVDLKFPDWTPMFLMTETDYDPMLGILKVFVYDLNGYYVGEFSFIIWSSVMPCLGAGLSR